MTIMSWNLGASKEVLLHRTGVFRDILKVILSPDSHSNGTPMSYLVVHVI